MFTGIVEEIGTVASIQKGAKSAVLTIQAKKVLEDVHIGDSIAVNGVCLTATTFTKDSYTADVMNETLQRSSLGSLTVGSKVNLERAMPLGGRFGGHIVSGHIDGTGTIQKIEKDDNAIWYTIAADKHLMRYIIEKGSIAIDGISLTVAKRNEKEFAISMIPHTAQQTVLSQKKVGDTVNLENDIVGKYIEQFLQPQQSFAKRQIKKESKLTKEFLMMSGF